MQPTLFDIGEVKQPKPEKKISKHDIWVGLRHEEIELILDSIAYFKKEVTAHKNFQWMGKELTMIFGLIDKIKIAQTKIIDIKLSEYEQMNVKPEMNTNE